MDTTIRYEREALPGQERKQLGRDTLWLRMTRVPIDTTDEEVHQFFASIGLDVPLDAIQVTANEIGRNPQAGLIVAWPNDFLAMLVNRAIGEAKFRGRYQLNATRLSKLKKSA